MTKAHSEQSSEPQFDQGAAFSWKLPLVALALGVVAVGLALVIGFMSYRTALSNTERAFRYFYLEEAKLLAHQARGESAASDQQVLHSLKQTYGALGERAPDEYMCIVDRRGRLLAHTLYPKTVGNDAGSNRVLGVGKHGSCSLRELPSITDQFVGYYVSSNGQEQIAAFVHVPGRGWTIGIHRSKAALRREALSALEPFLWGFLTVCGLMIPLSLLLLYLTVRRAHQGRLGAEMVVRQERQRFKGLVEEAPLGVTLIDPNGRYLYYNQKFFEMFGYAPDEIPDGASWLQRAIPDPDERRRATETWRRDLQVLSRGESILRVYPVRCKDGSTKQIEFRPVGMADGGTLVIYRDITEEETSRQLLRQSEERFRSLFEMAPDAQYIIDLQGKFLDGNRAVRTMLGYSRSELMGKDFMELGLMGPADQQRARRLLEQSRKGHATGPDALTLHRKDGETVTTEIMTIPITLEGREVVLVIARDVSERRVLEEQLRHAQKMEAVGTLAGGIAHDFNNILAAITGYAELALEDARNGRSDPDDLAQILEATGRAGDLVRRILAFSRKTEPGFKPLDLNREVEQATRMLERTIPRMVEIDLRLNPSRPVILGDEGQLQQVLLNLGANANDAMPGGGTLTISTDATVLDQEFCRVNPDVRPGRYARLIVSDTGEGIPPQIASHIFDPFFTTKEVGSGTGLGLAIVYGIVKSHHGHIECSSRTGEGTSFVIYLPMAEQGQVETLQPAPNGSQSRGGGETLLVVDDEPAILDVAERVLDRNGYRVFRANSGEEALDIYRARGKEIAAVLLDINMPGMGGLRCLEGLMAMDPEARVIIASGYLKEGESQDSLRAGAAGYVAKPYRKNELLETIISALNGGRPGLA